MRTIPTPLLLLGTFIAGWLNRQHDAMMEYRLEGIRVLREQLGPKCLILTDSERRRLAVKGKALGRKLLGEYATLFTPDTILRWHRELIAMKWMYGNKGMGRPPVSQEIEDLAVRMANENPSWGYDRIQRALANLGHTIAPNTVKRILKDHGIDPAPKRRKQTTWGQFLSAHWDSIAAADFFTAEVWTLTRGLVTYYVFFVIRLRDRSITVLPPLTNPDGFRMKQAALELCAFDDSFLRGTTHLIIDRDTKYTKVFRTILMESGAATVFIPARAPNCNAYAERFVRTARDEVIDRMIWFGERALRRGLSEFERHYMAERNHQGLGNRLIEPEPGVGELEGQVAVRSRLGGLLNYYHRVAA